MASESKVYPRIIQGGMGIAVSSWQLAREVSQLGQLGVVSGTAIDSVLARRLQDGDPTGDVRRALAHYPDQTFAQQILERHFIEGGRAADTAYIDVNKLTLKPKPFDLHMLVAAAFVEVWLAKEGHDGLIGINLLEKIQMSITPELFGAMLAGVDYVLIGAGIPAQIPAQLNALAKGEKATMRIDVIDAAEKFNLIFDPALISGISYPIKRPLFLAIVSSHILMTYLNKDDETKPDGYVIEYHSAGGHNAPPRKKNSTSEDGIAIYGELDEPNFEKILAQGSPFWLAGGYSTPEKLAEALSLGAQGVQVGSVFALAHESGFTQDVRNEVYNELRAGDIVVKSDALASPTGFPFKVIELETTLSNKDLYAQRGRICDLGYLRNPFKRENGTIGYRCAAEPEANYEFKGGKLEDTVGAKCLCNALMADIGKGQVRPDGRVELSLITMGSDLVGPKQLMALYPQGWSAKEAIAFLVGNK